MHDQPIQEDFLYMMLYGAAAMLSLIACCYLLLRRSNAIAPDVTSPVRLRRWSAAFFASMTLSHVWYLPELYLPSSEDALQATFVGATLDFMTFVPFGITVLFSMLQDRRRPAWPAFLMVAPLAVITTMCAISRSIDLLPALYAYYLLMGIGLMAYMVREVRRYGRWLCDNYADLEHKEIWQSLLVLAVIMSFFGIYTLDPHGVAYKYITQLNSMILVCFLLWRVETLSDLSSHTVSGAEPSLLSSAEGTAHESLAVSKPQNLTDTIGPMLQRHCIDTQLYLQHDLTAVLLAKAIGTNRYYLSQYFSQQGITYNAYINNLRIQHFMNLYRETVTAQDSFTAQQLALESGFHNYRTFSNAFKQQTGQTVTCWMKAAGKALQEQRKS